MGARLPWLCAGSKLGAEEAASLPLSPRLVGTMRARATRHDQGAFVAAFPEPMVRLRLRVHVQEYELPDGETVVGRGEGCRLTIDDPMMSRAHCAISVDAGRVTVRDLGSRNGTFVNGVRIDRAVELASGDRIRCGDTEALFTRIVETPANGVSQTAPIRVCASCEVPYVGTAPCCPRCGARPAEGTPTRSQSQVRRDVWLAVEVELLENALQHARVDDADESMQRIVEKLDALLAENKTFDDAQLEAALRVALRYSLVRGTGAHLGWVLDTLRAIDRAPTPELFGALAATPHILLEDAIEPLSRLVHAKRGRETCEAEASCVRSLAALLDDVLAFRLRRWDSTAPRKPHDALV